MLWNQEPLSTEVSLRPAWQGGRTVPLGAPQHPRTPHWPPVTHMLLGPSMLVLRCCLPAPGRYEPIRSRDPGLASSVSLGSDSTFSVNVYAVRQLPGSKQLLIPLKSTFGDAPGQDWSCGTSCEWKSLSLWKPSILSMVGDCHSSSHPLIPQPASNWQDSGHLALT